MHNLISGLESGGTHSNVLFGGYDGLGKKWLCAVINMVKNGCDGLQKAKQ